MNGDSDQVAATREKAKRVASWLVERGRPDEAVLLLSCWAVQGPNDEEGQNLLAEALRIDPSSKAAQQAFERMEGLTGTHDALDAALTRFDAKALTRLDAEALRPTFRRAQMGFNTNIAFRERTFHLQTEDSGLDAPHVITHLFVDGGAIVKSRKRSYSEHVQRSDVADFVRDLMRAQHLEMAIHLREGKFDDILAGKAIGGVEVLTEAPKVDLLKFKKKRTLVDSPAPSSADAPGAVADAGLQHATDAAQPEPAHAAAVSEGTPEPLKKQLYSLRVVRSLHGGPERYDVSDAVAVIGSEGAVNLEGETYCRAHEAVLTYRNRRLFIEDLEGGNGIFLRTRTPLELDFGDEFIIGDQLLRLEANPYPDDQPGPGPTYFYTSPRWPSSFRLVQLIEDGGIGTATMARGNALLVGADAADMNLREDPLIDPQHCLVEEQAGTIVLTDLDTRTGTFVRITGEQRVRPGDELLVGRTRLLVTME